MHEVKRKQQQSQNNEWGIKSEYKERSEKENSVKNINIPKGISITLIFFFFSSTSQLFEDERVCNYGKGGQSRETQILMKH